MMSLSVRDRRTLRDIERHLHAEDPTLDRLMRPSAGHRGSVARLSWPVLWSAVVLVVLGLVLGDSPTIIGGVLLLAVFPIVVRILAAALGVSRNSSPSDFV
jgi:Flp pilus assembly protein TadB